MEKLDENGLNKSSRILLLIGILFVAINLRPTLSSIGPLVDMIRQDIGVSEAMLGLLTTLPLIAFGVISTITPLFTKRFGIGNTLLGALVLLTFGILIRSLGGIFALYFGTILLGIAIAFGNVLIPALIKRNFPHKAGLVTSLYSGIMSLGAAVAAGLSFPLANQLNLGWKGSLAIWSVLAILALMIWIPNVKRINRTPPRRSFADAMKKLSGSLLVWRLALYMGLQSFAFYLILAWLPEVLSLIGLLIPQMGWIELWVGLNGMVLGGTFGLALLLIVLRSGDAETAAELSGIVQSIGYLIAATGPFIAGVIFDLTEVWDYALTLLIGVAIIKLIMGIGVGKDRKV